MRGGGVEGVTGLGGSGEGRGCGGCDWSVTGLGGSGEWMGCGGCDWSRRVR